MATLARQRPAPQDHVDVEAGLERRIDLALAALVGARTLEARYSAYHAMRALMSKRSPQHILELERERLARCGIAAP
jgi:hypothetical protein